MWSTTRSWVPYPLLHLPRWPSLPGPAALLWQQWLSGPCVFPDDQGEAASSSRLLDHPGGYRRRAPPEQGGHRHSQPGSQAEAGLQSAFVLRDLDPGSSGAREAVRAVQHPRGEGLSGSFGLLHDGDGTCAGGDAAPQAWREGPGAAFRGHWHRLEPEDSVQTNRIPAATAERHGETIHSQKLQEVDIKKWSNEQWQNKSIYDTW